VNHKSRRVTPGKAFYSAAAEHGVAAERLDRGDFAMQKRYNVVLLYQRDTSSRPLNAKPLGGISMERHLTHERE
jgi:hypothetical protein